MCVPTAEEMQIIENAMQYYTKAIMKYSAHKLKSSSAGSSGLQCMKTPKISSEGVGNASCMGASPLAT
jgi:hypothetical protein